MFRNLSIHINFKGKERRRLGKRFLVLILCLSMILPVNAIQAFATNEDEAVEEISTSIVPECECDNGSEDLAAHSDSQCSLKAYCIETADNKTADELYAMWNEFPANGQAFILTYLSWGQQEKLEQLNVLLNGSGTEESSVENTASDGMKVTVSGNLPENAGVEIEVINDADIKEAFENPAYFYDIKLNQNGNSYQPDEQVTVKLNINVDSEQEVIVYHILEDSSAIKKSLEDKTAYVYENENMASLMPSAAAAVKAAIGIDNAICIEGLTSKSGDVVIEENGISFNVDSFSNFAIYTVDFHYNGKTVCIPGESGILLSALFEQLGINKNSSSVENVLFTDEKLVSVEKQLDGDWLLVSNEPFSSLEKLSIMFADGEILEINVTDHNSANDAVHTHDGGATAQGYTIFSAISGVSGSWSVWDGGAHKITVNLYNDKGFVDYSYFDEHPQTSGWLTMSGNYWYEVTDYDFSTGSPSRRDTNTLIMGDMGAPTWLFGGTDNSIEIRMYPLDIWEDETHCDINQVSKFANDKSGETGNRTVIVYANGTQIHSGSYYMPTFESIASSDLKVSPKTGWVHQKTEASGSTYKVYLTSVHTIIWKNGNGDTIETDTNVAYGSTPSYNGGTPTKTSTAQYSYTWNGGWSPSVSTVTKNVTYTATFEAVSKTYVATASAEIGIGSVSGSGNYKVGSKVPFAATVKPGYTWDGWYNSTGTKVSGSTSYTFTMPNSAVTYTAKATPNTYYVKFDSNTGTGTMSNQTFTYDKAQNLTANAFSKAGHTFDGWNTASDGSGKPFGDKASVSNLTATNGATITLFAQWKINKHIATANKETGVKEVTGSGTYDYGTDVTFKVTLKDGYEFAGWYDASGNKVSDSAEYTFTMPDNDVTYTAKAKAAEVKYTVKHMIKDYGEDEYYQYKESVEMTGHVDDETVAKAIKILGYTVIEPIAQKKITADGKTVVEIYYDENVINITYNSNNNNYGTVDPTQETTGATTSSLIGSVPTAQKGYKFVGWYKDKACTNAVNADWVIKDTNRLIPQKVDGLNEETDYYAKFEPIKSTIIVKMFVDGEMADKTKLFTGKVNYSVHSGTDDVSVPYSLKDGAVSETITVDAGKQVWLTDLLTDEKYTLDKVELNGTAINNDDVQNFVEGEENVFCIYYSSKDVPATGIDEGSNGLMVMLLTVAIFFVGFLFFGKRYRRNEV